MTLKQEVRFLPEPVQELEDAVLWYRQKSPALGEHFAVSLETTIERILEFPESFPIYRRSARQALIPRFPYGIFYVPGPNVIHIVAVFHLRQDPAKLKKRV